MLIRLAYFVVRASTFGSGHAPPDPIPLVRLSSPGVPSLGHELIHNHVYYRVDRVVWVPEGEEDVRLYLVRL